MNTAVLILGVGALLVALVLYFIFLPHIEGPSLDDQRAEHKLWLVECPNCGRWEPREPVSSTKEEAAAEQKKTFTNWYRCLYCDHRWHEEHAS